MVVKVAVCAAVACYGDVSNYADDARNTCNAGFDFCYVFHRCLSLLVGAEAPVDLDRKLVGFEESHFVGTSHAHCHHVLIKVILQLGAIGGCRNSTVGVQEFSHLVSFAVTCGLQ